MKKVSRNDVHSFTISVEGKHNGLLVEHAVRKLIGKTDRSLKQSLNKYFVSLSKKDQGKADTELWHTSKKLVMNGIKAMNDTILSVLILSDKQYKQFQQNLKILKRKCIADRAV